MQTDLIQLADLAGPFRCAPAWPVSRHHGVDYSSAGFASAVDYWAAQFGPAVETRFALYAEDAYPFAIGLFALLQAGKEAWIPGNNLPDTAWQLAGEGCRLVGDWQDGPRIDPAMTFQNPADSRSLPGVTPASRIVLYTSGSSGLSKAVPKTLRQLQAEVETLDRLWGKRLKPCNIAGTVSHQHIYGLLFRVLWPLAARRCFYSKQFLSPEALLAGTGNPAKTCWIASPGHLKRLDERSPWPDIGRLAALFSSGGPLPREAAARIAEQAGRCAIEVYGSTETGGIAWRMASGTGDVPWRPFSGIRIAWQGETALLHSPFLEGGAPFKLDDRLTAADDGCFNLCGRADRIVKVEEKRLSLTALEQRLQQTGWVSEAYAQVLARQRDTVAIAAVLSAKGAETLRAQGRNVFVRRLRSALADSFDAVGLPRKWLFVNRIPLTAQGKVDRDLLASLLNTDTRTLPKVLAADCRTDGVALKIRVPRDLSYFADHFQNFPLLPGVVQIGWAEHFGRLFFPFAARFSHLEAIKFGKIIHPGEELELSLEWRDNAHKLYFRYAEADQTSSSGRLVYGGAA